MQNIQACKIFFYSLLFFTVILSLISCTSTRYITQTQRSAVEQLLVAKSIDRAVEKADDLSICNTKVFIELASLAKEEEVYIKRALSHWFLEKGAIVVEDKKEAELIASALVKCVGTDRLESDFGLPSIPIPISGMTTPPLNILRLDRQKGVSEMEIVLYSANSKDFKQKTKVLVGEASYNYIKIILIPLYWNNIY